MNSFRTLGLSIVRVTVGAAVVALAAAAQAAVEKGSAKVVAVHGSAEVSMDGSTWTSLKRGESLREGAMVRTPGGAVADLDLGRNGSMLRVMPQTTMAFTALTYEQTGIETIVNTEIDLREGRLLGHVQKLSAASKYEIKTPKTVAGVRGTRYDISADGNVVVAEGSVVVVAYQADGTTITRVVNAAEAFSPVSGLVTPATEQQLGEVGGSASSVPGIVALPGLEPIIIDNRVFLNRAVLPVLPSDTLISRAVPANGETPGEPNGEGNGTPEF